MSALADVIETGAWRAWPDSAKRELAAKLRRLHFEQRRQAWQPYPWQVPPVHRFTAGEMWLLFGGRGTGKTDGAARYVADHVAGPACDERLPGGHRIAIVAPTLGDAVESCVLGPSGLQAHSESVRTWTSPGGTYVEFGNGALGKVFGAYTPEDVERLRAGGNRCLVWWEELAAWRHLDKAMEHSRYGLRLGATPHIVASTTPKPRRAIFDLVADTRVHTTRGRTQDAHHLDAAVRADLLKRYAGSRSGRQELEGELLEDVEGALWSYDVIEAGRVRHLDASMVASELARIVVAIDPAATDKESSDETGVLVVGSSQRNACPVCGPVEDVHGFVLEDRSKRYSPEQWGRAAVAAYEKWDASEVVAEVNNGGDMVGHVIRTIDKRVPYREVRATRGKRVRAEPVAALYAAQSGPRVHHVGVFAALEEQQTTWTPDDAESPDRMDALVWGLTRLLVKRRGGAASVA